VPLHSAPFHGVPLHGSGDSNDVFLSTRIQQRGLEPGASLSTLIEQNGTPIPAGAETVIQQRGTEPVASLSTLIYQISHEPNTGIYTLIEQDIAGFQLTLRSVIQQRGLEPNAGPYTLIEQRQPSAQIFTVIQQRSVEPLAIETLVEQNSFDPGRLFTHSWAVRVLVDGSERKVSGRIRIDRETGAAATAHLSVRPVSGAIDLADWKGKSITVDVDAYTGTEVVWRSRRFTGVIDVPGFDPRSKRLELECLDRRNMRLLHMPRELIAAEVGGLWSAHIFTGDPGKIEYAEQRLSTRTADYQLNRHGVPEITQWEIAGTPDVVLGASDYYDGSLRFEPGGRQDVLNHLVLNFDFRRAILWEREYSFNWALPVSWCTYLQDTFTLPTRAEVESACAGTDWTLAADIHFTDVPPPQVFYCPGEHGPSGAPAPRFWGYQQTGYGYSPDLVSLAALCQGFQATFRKRWAQTETTTYTFNMLAPQSIAAMGVIADEQSFFIEADQPGAEDWEKIAAYEPPDGVSLVSMSNGDQALDDISDALDDLHVAMLTGLAQGLATIRASHRHNFTEMDVPMRPDLDLGDTVRLEADGLTCEGVAVQMTDDIVVSESGAGRARTTLRLAHSAHHSVGVIVEDTTLEAPDPPDTVPPADPAAVRLLSANGFAYLHLGNRLSSPPFDEAWAGFVSNYDVNDDDEPFSTDPSKPQAEVYTVQMRVPTPAIEAALRDEATASVERRVPITIPDDTLELTA